MPFHPQNTKESGQFVSIKNTCIFILRFQPFYIYVMSVLGRVNNTGQPHWTLTCPALPCGFVEMPMFGGMIVS